MDSTNNQIKKKPILLALAATLCNRKMLKVKAPLYTEPLRLFLFYNCFKGVSFCRINSTIILNLNRFSKKTGR